MTAPPAAPPRHFLAIPDLARAELDALLALAERMRRGSYTARPLAGKSLAMIFMKASTRTRVSFEAVSPLLHRTAAGLPSERSNVRAAGALRLRHGIKLCTNVFACPAPPCWRAI